MSAVTNTYAQLHAALMQVSLQIQPVMKGAVHADTGCTYATLDQIQEALEPALRLAQLVLLPDFHLAQGILHCAVTVVHVPSGESYTARMPVLIDASEPWSCAAGVTTGRRLLLVTLFNIRCIDDPGAHGATAAPRATASASAAGDIGTYTPDGRADRISDPQPPGETQRAQQAIRELTAMWIAATRRLGVAACTALLTRDFQVTSLCQLPPAAIPLAAAALRCAVQDADAAAADPASDHEMLAAPSAGSSPSPVGSCGCVAG